MFTYRTVIDTAQFDTHIWNIKSAYIPFYKMQLFEQNQCHISYDTSTRTVTKFIEDFLLLK